MSLTLLQPLFSPRQYSLEAHLRQLRAHHESLLLEDLLLFAHLLLPPQLPPARPLLSNIFFDFQLKQWYIKDSTPTKSKRERLQSRRMGAEIMLRLLDEADASRDMLFKMSKPSFNFKPEINEELLVVLQRLNSCLNLREAQGLVSQFKSRLISCLRQEMSKTLSETENQCNNSKQGQSCKARVQRDESQTTPSLPPRTPASKNFNSYVIFLVIVGLVVLMGGTTFLYLLKRRPWKLQATE